MAGCHWSVAALVGGTSTSRSTAHTSRSLAWEDEGGEKQNLENWWEMGESCHCGGRVRRKAVRRSPQERRRRRGEVVLTVRREVEEERGESCEGSSEGSEEHSDEEEQEREDVVPRTVLARTRRSLAQQQLETSSSQQLACLTCLKR